ncbi:MAG: hypothetical protein HQK87_01055 [Nitrospinae bacterium]|nr:hypothetical protein [Nitrospinota bacterium]
MSAYPIKPIDTFSRRSDATPLTRAAYEELNSVSRPRVAQEPAKVEISSAAGRQSMLAALKQKFNVGPVAASLVGSLTPSPSSGFSSGLYAGVGQLSSSQVHSLINGYV